jgi:DNA-binding NarL/FixJ family response regulator
MAIRDIFDQSQDSRKELSPAERMVFDMRREGWRYSDIDAKLGTKRGTASGVMCRACKKLGIRSAKDVTPITETAHRKQLLELWLAGKTVIQVSVEMNMAPNTVTSAISKYIYPKYGVHNRAELIEKIAAENK